MSVLVPREAPVRARMSMLAILTTTATSCAGGSSGLVLAYRLPTPAEASYSVTDTAIVSIDAMGQSLEISVGSAGVYGVTFAPAEEGVTVTLSVDDLAASVALPIGAPMTFDESSVDGDLVFTLDERGNATVVSTPELAEPAGQLVPPGEVANSFFPALPGTAVAPGATWVDTTSFGDPDDASAASRSIVTYTAVGDTVVDGRSLLAISFRGTSQVSQNLEMQGAQMQQTTDLQIEGGALWDARAGLMFERWTNATGTGSVRVNVLPAQLPTRFQSRSRVRLAQP